MIQYNLTLKKYISIPCGRCLNCMITKRQEWEERCEWEYKCRLVGSFVTLTYDDEHMVHLARTDNRGNIQFSLDKKDLSDFIKRVREQIKRYPDRNKALMQGNFKWIACGEYGESNKELPRPHLHILFFGLDFTYCKKLIEKEWKYGICDTRPILNGGIRYVLKYMDKQLNNEENFEKYDRKCIIKPFKSQSKNLGSGLYKHKLRTKEANADNNYTYKGKNNIPKRIPQYWIDKYYGVAKEKPTGDIQYQIDLYNAAHGGQAIKKGNCLYFPEGRGNYAKLREWNRYKALEKEANNAKRMRDDGKAVNDEWKSQYVPYWQKPEQDKTKTTNLAKEAQDEWYNDEIY